MLFSLYNRPNQNIKLHPSDQMTIPITKLPCSYLMLKSQREMQSLSSHQHIPDMYRCLGILILLCMPTQYYTGQTQSVLKTIYESVSNGQTKVMQFQGALHKKANKRNQCFQKLIKIRPLQFHFMESLHHTAKQCSVKEV